VVHRDAESRAHQEEPQPERRVRVGRQQQDQCHGGSEEQVRRLPAAAIRQGADLGGTDCQRAVLCATLAVLASASGPDTYVELPFQWPETPAQARNASKDLPPPPVVELLKEKPWLLANLYSGRIPHGDGGAA
jgi:hypothetical protein